MHNFGMKWKDFFLELEVYYGLDPSKHHHIWLVHYLWLDVINRDAQDWMGMWNSHRMTLPHSSPRTPREMFRSSMIADGPRGLADLFAWPVDDEVEDIEAFGIDWDMVDDATYMDHLRRHNPEEWDATNPFSVAPPKMVHIPVDLPECPFNQESMDILAATLAERVDLMSRQMDVHRLVWLEAMNLCNYLLRTQNAGSDAAIF